jgi:CTP synthase
LNSESTKFIFVTGGVLSSVGKGVVTASIGKMLQSRSIIATAVKIDPYLNVDAGTMNPYTHGEVFVTEDGGETDLDLGHYERFLDSDLPSENNITTGQVYRSVIEKERDGKFLGKCVQIIPHITDEIKHRIRRVADHTKADVVIVEVGGTAGDIEGLPFLEAIRQIRLEEGVERTLFVHVALVPVLSATKEQKTKPAQHSIQELRRIGIQPDIVVARTQDELDSDSRSKIALYGSVPLEAVYSSYDVDVIYRVPMILDEQGMGDYICKRLSLSPTQAQWKKWEEVIGHIENGKDEVTIGLCGKYTKLEDSYESIKEAVTHAAAAANVSPKLVWIDSEKLHKESTDALKKLSECDGVIVLPGFGARGTEGKIAAAKYLRENAIPFLGICFGLQLAVIEFARNVAGLKEADSAEVNPEANQPVIDLLPEQHGGEKLGGTMRLGAQASILENGSLANLVYGKSVVFERHRHRYEVNPAYWEVLQRHGLIFSGWSPDKHRVEFIELRDHPFFLATQAHPEFKSRPGKPSPPYLALVKACVEHKKVRLGQISTAAST